MYFLDKYLTSVIFNSPSNYLILQDILYTLYIIIIITVLVTPIRCHPAHSWTQTSPIFFHIFFLFSVWVHEILTISLLSLRHLFFDCSTFFQQTLFSRDSNFSIYTFSDKQLLRNHLFQMVFAKSFWQSIFPTSKIPTTTLRDFLSSCAKKVTRADMMAWQFGLRARRWCPNYLHNTSCRMSSNPAFDLQLLREKSRTWRTWIRSTKTQ